MINHNKTDIKDKDKDKDRLRYWNESLSEYDFSLLVQRSCMTMSLACFLIFVYMTISGLSYTFIIISGLACVVNFFVGIGAFYQKN